jgi:UDP-N-acetylmuramyl pentapeptide synthase
MVKNMEEKGTMKTLNELLRDVDIIAASGNLEIGVAGITNDSRKVEKNNCFVAIKGFKQDGIEYVEDAVKKGANSIVDSGKERQVCLQQDGGPFLQ